MIIAIDGPAGAGKSTIARLIAQKLGFLYIDTGAMYRALTLIALDTGLDLKEPKEIIELASNININLTNNDDGSLRLLLNGKDVSKEIREPRISKFVSDIARIKEVRQVMLGLQRKLGTQKDSVLDGRDIGTVVFPDADKKFYLDAHFKERVKRRHLELNGLDQKIDYNDVEQDLNNRDTIDSTRKEAPLKRAEDAIYIDTTNMTIEEVAKVILKEITKISNIPE